MKGHTTYNSYCIAVQLILHMSIISIIFRTAYVYLSVLVFVTMCVHIFAFVSSIRICE